MLSHVLSLHPLVAPVRERGLKLNHYEKNLKCREVAPVRERGLKSNMRWTSGAMDASRSREGAWIEMYRFLQS